MPDAATRAQPDPGKVVLEAAVRASDLLGISQSHLARIIGVDPSTLSRRLRAGKGLEPSSKEYEAALLWIRLFRSLDAIVGSHDASARAWLASPNLAFAGQRPRELVDRTEGLVRVLHYLDAHRAKI
jgi:uncharacterized protein (DUF2384 family)